MIPGPCSPGPCSPGLNFGVFEYHTPSIQNKTDIGKFINVSRSFILNTPHRIFKRSVVSKNSKILTR